MDVSFKVWLFYKYSKSRNRKRQDNRDEFLTAMRASGEISEETDRKLVRENAVRQLGL